MFFFTCVLSDQGTEESEDQGTEESDDREIVGTDDEGMGI